MSLFESQRRFLWRFFRAVFSWRTLRRLLLTGVGLVTLIVLFFMEEWWRGQRDWEAYKHEQEVQGVKFDRAAFAPSPVPDDQNFVRTPLLNALYSRGSYHSLESEKVDKLVARLKLDLKSGWLNSLDWPPARPIDLKTWQAALHTPDILGALQPLSPELDEITAASRRPYAQFHNSIDYWPWIPFGVLRQLVQLYYVRALAELDQGDAVHAAEDIETILRLTNLLKESYSTGAIWMSRWAVTGIWAGLAAHQWSDRQLAAFQTEFQKLDFIASERRGMEMDRARITELTEKSPDPARFWPTFYALFGLEQFGVAEHFPVLWPLMEFFGAEDYRSEPGFGLPRGWMLQNLVNYNRGMATALEFFDPARHRIDVAKIEQDDKAAKDWRPGPYDFLYKFAAEYRDSVAHSVARAQTTVDEARVACALERYRLANGQFPETLAALVPQFLDKVPPDVIGGEPLKYRREGGGQYLLYSVGWNGQDDGGKIVPGGSAPVQGDWVWPYPIK